MLPPLKLESIPNQYLWVLLEDYIVTIGDTTIRVPKGFKTDLATVPRVFQPLFPPDGVYKEAAVVHDYLLARKNLSRRQCDRLFYKLMRENGVGVTASVILYSAVSLFSRVKRYI